MWTRLKRYRYLSFSRGTTEFVWLTRRTIFSNGARVMEQAGTAGVAVMLGPPVRSLRSQKQLNSGTILTENGPPASWPTVFGHVWLTRRTCAGAVRPPNAALRPATTAARPPCAPWIMLCQVWCTASRHMCGWHCSSGPHGRAGPGAVVHCGREPWAATLGFEECCDRINGKHIREGKMFT